MSTVKYKTSPYLEEIVSGFNLRLLEVIKRPHPTDSEKDEWNLRLDFSAKDDSGRWFVGGSSSTYFERKTTPREFCNQLRRFADAIDAYWARAFPTALKK